MLNKEAQNHRTEQVDDPPRCEMAIIGGRVKISAQLSLSRRLVVVSKVPVTLLTGRNQLSLSLSQPAALKADN